jgi:hypothetical protein
MNVDAATPDGRALAQLARSGADLGVLHRIVFRLRFPDARSAAAAVPKLAALAFATERERAGEGPQRFVLATKVMYPREPDLQGLRDKLDVIAAEGDGSYEGWQAFPHTPDGPAR